ncbi:MAG TPA: substrate-binding domain-containing protein [Casimicrobiaceae bacterium]|jgi:molybdate transport system substrate-binding protein|nr:substrate-binding domain-containing protein [Casimicrobiaceae bacterium]
MTVESRKDRITGISSMAMRNVLAELGDAYEQQSGQPVSVVSVGGVDAARRVDDGEAFDFVVLAADAIEQLAASGRVAPDSRTDLAHSSVAIAVAAEAPRPDVGSEAAIRDAVLRARSIGYSTGPSGAYIVRLFERWGIAEAIAPRIVQAPPGLPVGTLVARGDVELGFQQLSELMHLPGIDVIGLLPPEIQAVTVFSAAVCTASNRPAAAEALLSFLASPEADTTKRRHGMEPA